MKTLLILRHAKSGWSDQAATDFDRTLNDRGRRDAPRVGELLLQQNLLPEVILASSAVRTMETAHLLVEAANFRGELQPRPDLYLAAAPQYLNVLAELGDAVESALVLGHNPGLQMLVSHLAGVDLTMPTAALAWFELPVTSWGELELVPTGELRHLWRPKEMEATG